MFLTLAPRGSTSARKVGIAPAQNVHPPWSVPLVAAALRIS
jgi:hypothetical protein